MPLDQHAYSQCPSQEANLFRSPDFTQSNNSNSPEKSPSCPHHHSSHVSYRSRSQRSDIPYRTPPKSLFTQGDSSQVFSLQNLSAHTYFPIVRIMEIFFDSSPVCLFGATIDRLVLPDVWYLRHWNWDLQLCFFKLRANSWSSYDKSQDTYSNWNWYFAYWSIGPALDSLSLNQYAALQCPFYPVWTPVSSQSIVV